MAARRRAARHDLCTPMGLDDEDLDVPGYEPGTGWRPAIGRGIAEDIHIPRELQRAGEERMQEIAGLEMETA